MSKFHSISTNDFFQGFIAVDTDTALEGLPRLRELIAREFDAASVTYGDGKIYVQLRNVDAIGNQTVSDKVWGALVDAYPHLAAEPPTIVDDVLGVLRWDLETNGYQGNAALNGNDIELLILGPSQPPPSAAIERARDVVLNWSNWWSTARQLLVRDFMTLHNNEWRESDESAIGQALSASAFLARLSPFALHVEPDLWCLVYFDADGMFTEHGITIRISAEDEVTALIE